ncbi:MAG: hypothetical protein ACTSO7_00880 [Candidatus Heimdallarchaeota archaeon]
MMVDFLSILESSWLPILIVSILFIFILLFRDLGERTRKLAKWQRISYQKTIAKVSMSFQHFSRKGELLTNTSHNICRSIHKDLINLFSVTKGLSEEDLARILSDPDELTIFFQNPGVVLFLYNPNAWLQEIQPDKSIIEKVIKAFQGILKETDAQEELFLIELATVVNKFRKALES